MRLQLMMDNTTFNAYDQKSGIEIYTNSKIYGIQSGATYTVTDCSFDKV